MRSDFRSRISVSACALFALAFSATTLHAQSLSAPRSTFPGSGNASAASASASATLRFDSATGPTTKTIVRLSGSPVTFAWTTTNLPSGTSCRIYLRPDDRYQVLAAPAVAGAHTDTSINTWGSGSKVFYLRCSNGTASSNITLTIQPPAPQRFANLRFDSETGPQIKSIVRNSGTPVTFAWRTGLLAAGTTCRIYLRPDDRYQALATPVAGGTRTDNSINTWATGTKEFYLGCSDGTRSGPIKLFILSAPPTASLYFYYATGPTTDTIVRNSGSPVTFAWTTTNLPSGTCHIFLRPDDRYRALAAPNVAGILTDTSINTWSSGTKVFYLGCSYGNEPNVIATSNDITLTILPGEPRAASLRFDTINGPTTKTIGRNSGTSVTFAWQTVNLPSGMTCRIYLRPDDRYQALASPVAGGSRIDSTINTWASGAKVFYLGCTDGTVSSDITLTIQPPLTPGRLTINATGSGTGTVTISGSATVVPDCTAFPCVRDFTGSPTVTLRAIADGNSVFIQWSGACSGMASTCDVTMNTQQTVTASFSILEGHAVAISAGVAHTCALTDHGAVKCWGYNFDGQLGDGSRVDRIIPMDVSGLNIGVQAVAAGNYHTCALTAAGAIKCWGDNGNGRLGDGTETNRLTPVNVSGLDGGMRAVTAGSAHSCAITGSGTVKCWGANYYGQLGNGGVAALTPTDVLDLGSDVQAIAAGNDHSCAITAVGGLKCWGDNSHGQLGDGSSLDRATPVDVVGLSSGVIAIAAGSDRTCALTVDGAVKCWGDNYYGQLGNGSSGGFAWTPTNVVGLESGVIGIAAGFDRTCAVTDAGVVKCWGYDYRGQGTMHNSMTPVNVPGLDSGVRAITLGAHHTCAVTDAGTVLCWGDNSNGVLGNGDYPNFRLMPVDVVALGGGMRSVAAGLDHGCGLTLSGGVKCWGSNQLGQLGDGVINSTSSEPGDVIGLTGDVQTIAAGGLTSCALTNAGGVKCWGLDYHQYAQISVPVDIAGLETGVMAIATNGSSLGDHSCALTTAGAVKCWGSNAHGQLGDGTTINRTTPVAVSGLDRGVLAITAGFNHTCALTDSGALKCWGSNEKGELGDGSTIERLTPVNVSNLGSGVQSITAGGDHTCAVTDAGALMCWGDNFWGQLGDGTTENRLTPVNVFGLGGDVQAMVAGDSHTCAVKVSGVATCWGHNNFGQLGDGSSTDHLTPMPVSNLASGVQMMAAGGSHTCALTSVGGIKCWGLNVYGQLGDGSNYSLIPVGVVGFSAL